MGKLESRLYRLPGQEISLGKRKANIMVKKQKSAGCLRGLENTEPLSKVVEEEVRELINQGQAIYDLVGHGKDLRFYYYAFLSFGHFLLCEDITKLS